MKKVLFVLVCLFALTMNVFAVTEPEIQIFTYKAEGRLNDGFREELAQTLEIEVGEEYQLYAISIHGNEMPTGDPTICGLTDNECLGIGWYVYTNDLNHIIWGSSDETVATVDYAGKVTALKEGTVTITVYEEVIKDPLPVLATKTVKVVPKQQEANEEEKKEESSKTSKTTTNPNTGISTWVGLTAILSIAAGSVYVLKNKKELD